MQGQNRMVDFKTHDYPGASFDSLHAIQVGLGELHLEKGHFRKLGHSIGLDPFAVC
jgi:hypothetical protein